MKQALLRGVPLAMQRDGWWLGPIEQAPSPQPRTARTCWVGPGALIALVALGDVLVWQVSPGLSLALFGALIGAAALALSGLTERALGLAAGGLALSLLPLVELVQPLSLLIWLAGFSGVCAFAAGLRRPQLIRAALRLWWVGPWASLFAIWRTGARMGDMQVQRVSATALLTGWALPLGLGAVFALLLIGANPVLDRWLIDLLSLDLPRPNGWRLAFWALLALLIWPFLHLPHLTERLRPSPPRQTVRRPGLLNAASVTRSLILFNGLFAVQTIMDAVLLGGGASLPEGMSYATYAHRGAYPLLVTALLAGGFAALASPLADRRLVRWLLLLWIAQTLALVAASVVRLETYVEVYALTRLRLAAFIWMGVVALGLAITFAQVATRKSTGWLLTRTGALGAVTLYLCAFVSFDAIVARHNLANIAPRDPFYVCGLSEAAIPAILDWQNRSGRRLCHYTRPKLYTPHDWREWGFRNARLRHSLTAMEQSR